MSKHTPGPWRIARRKKTGHATTCIIEQEKPRYPGSKIVGDSHLRIAEVFAHRFGSADNIPGDGPNDLANSDREGCQQKNAALIVAAPDLLAALEAIAGILGDSAPIDYKRDCFESLKLARAAIARAKGGAQ